MAEVKPAGGAKAKRDIFAGDDPYALARAWLTEAEATELNDPSATALATADKSGLPNVRMVLLKEIEANQAKGGFVFYTNHESAKGRELAENPQAALVMHWKSLRRQVRVRGPVEPAPAAMSDAYYNSRAYQSRIGAWASRQSRPLRSRAALMADVAKYARALSDEAAAPAALGRLPNPTDRDRVLGRRGFPAARPVPLDAGRPEGDGVEGRAAEPVTRRAFAPILMA